MKTNTTNYPALVLALFFGLMAPEAIPEATVGINLTPLSDWEPVYPMVDLFKSTRKWISQREGAGWEQGPPLELDDHGWIKRLEPNCFAEVPLFFNTPGSMPAGDYLLLYDGEGTLQIREANVVSNELGRLVIRIDETSKTLWVKITATNPADHIRNIRLILPGFEATYQDDPWNPQFLERWRGTACLRFMDWMDTNNSEIETWADRPLVEDMSYSGYFAGVPLEHLIDLANRLNTDAWFCMPGRADDDYVRKTAEMVQEKLNPNLKAYVEYSNEVWNSMFSQTHENTEKAKTLGIGPPERPWEGNGMLYTQRTLEIGAIWHDVFDDDSRVVRVLAWQANAWWIENILFAYQESFNQVDAVAIAPYINLAAFAEADGHDGPTAEEISQWSEEDLLDYVTTNCLAVATHEIQSLAEVTHAKNLKLLAYEGGQHFVGVQNGVNNNDLTTLLTSVNKNPRMQALYETYFNTWTEAGGNLFCYYVSTGRWSKWGGWGVLDRYDADPALSPKYLALIEWAQRCGQPMTLQDYSK